MNNVELKSDLHSLIDRVNDMAMLSAIKTILKTQVEDANLWEELPLDVQESVKKGMDQTRNGRSKPHAEVIKKYEKWL